MKRRTRNLLESERTLEHTAHPISTRAARFNWIELRIATLTTCASQDTWELRLLESTHLEKLIAYNIWLSIAACSIAHSIMESYRILPMCIPVVSGPHPTPTPPPASARRRGTWDSNWPIDSIEHAHSLPPVIMAEKQSPCPLFRHRKSRSAQLRETGASHWPMASNFTWMMANTV